MWTSYVINLAPNVERMHNSARQLEAHELPYQRIDAVNGWELAEDQIAEVYDARANARRGRYPLVSAEIGCYLSHIEAWRAIAAADEPGGFVFEDDFAANDTLRPVLEALVADAARDWDMVKLFFLDTGPRVHASRPLDRDFRLVVPDKVPTCQIAYGLTRGAAAHLAARALPFFRPVDEDQKFFWETGLRVALVLPPPIVVGDQQAETGTIGNARRAAEAGRSRGGQALHGLNYQLRYRALLRWHRWRKTGMQR